MAKDGAEEVSRYSELVQASGKSLREQERERELCWDFALRFTRGLREYLDVAPENMLCFKPSEGSETAAARPAHGTVQRQGDGFYAFGIAIRLEGPDVFPYRPSLTSVIEMLPVGSVFQLRINDSRTRTVPIEPGEADKRAREEVYDDMFATTRREITGKKSARRMGF